MSRIAIIAALPGELAPLVRGWEKRGHNVWIGRLADRDCIAIAGGMGSESATRACELALGEGDVNVLVSVGWAGSLSCGLKPCSANAVYEIIDAKTGERFATDYSAGYKLVTLDHVAGVEEKRQLATKHQAVLVDMEAAAVARVASERNISFYCFKAVSDGSNDVLPDFSRFIGQDGQMRMIPFLAYIAFRPRYWAALKRLGENSKGAASSLQTMVTKGLEQAL